MDDKLRNKLQKATQDARGLLEHEFAEQLEGTYDILPDGTIQPKPGKHLDDRERLVRGKLVDAIEHIKAGGKKPAEAVDEYVREAAFTFLNRFVALKMLEARDLVQQCVSKGDQSSGFKEFTGLAPGMSELPDDGYRLYLECLFDELSIEVKVLFDRRDPASLLWPRRQALTDLLAILNQPELAGVWGQDETIGWVYQYFNSGEERKKMREESQAPRNSRELAVRNQFFTPRYVVEFLTDNTLGRIWYEMRQGDTRLTEECRYLVRRPDEVFLEEAESDDQKAAAQWLQGQADAEPDIQALAHTVNGYRRAGEAGEQCNAWVEQRLTKLESKESTAKLKTQELLDLLFLFCRKERFCEGTLESLQAQIDQIMAVLRDRVAAMNKEDASQEELLKQPVHIPFRAKKDPRDLKILDPACGSGHFLLYCFDLLLTVYEEAWRDEQSPKSEITGRTIREDYATIEALREAVPSLILRHNLHGIDIDSRCAQIAAFALWMRAQWAFNEFGLDRAIRPAIRKTNIVVAEPMPGEKDLLREFTAKLQPPLLGQLVEVIFDKMQLAGEAGSLLKIEEELRDAIAKAREQWVSEPKNEQMLLFADDRPKVEQLVFDLSGITDDQFWQEAESQTITALREFSESRANGAAYRRALFADDAAAGFAFIDLCRKRYDVALMNPPFGDVAIPARKLVDGQYPDAKADLYAAFFDRALQLTTLDGLVGQIASRLGLFVSSLVRWRMSVFFSEARLCFLADLGHGVLDDALVEAAAYVAGKSPATDSFWACGVLNHSDKGRALASAVNGCPQGLASVWELSALTRIPGVPIAYWLQPDFVSHLLHHPPMLSGAAEARVGLQTDDDFRFLRLAWECDPTSIPERWRYFAKGGEYSPFYDDIHLTVNWGNNAAEMRAFIEQRHSWTKRASSADMYGLPGLTYPERTTSEFSPRVLPRETVFSIAGPAILPFSEGKCFALLALAYTRLVRIMIEMYVGGGDAVHSGSAARHYKAGILNKCAVPSLENAQGEELAEIGRECARLVQGRWQHEETSRIFSGLSPNNDRSIRDWVRSRMIAYEDILVLIEGLTARSESLAFALYGLNPKHRSSVAQTYGAHTSELGAVEDTDDLDALFQMPLDRLVNLVAEQVGYSRQTTKLAYLTDRRYEAIALLKSATVDQIVQARRLAGILPEETLRENAVSWVSYLFGCAVGRWDHEYVSSQSAGAELPDLLAPLPSSPPAAARSSCGDRDRPDVLVDDRGHPNDVAQQVRNSANAVWAEAEAVWRELPGLLGCSTDGVRGWFRRSFFDTHIKRYSKSRRKAPIYWQLATQPASYSVWLYYHRFTPDTLYTALNDHVKPKLDHEQRKLDRLRTDAGPEPTRSQRSEIDQQETFVAELKTFAEEIERIAPLWNPDLNDGVIINFAPLWRLVPQHKAWQKECKACWDKLVAGDYDWAHLAMHLWPERVVPKCRTDASLAIAHGVESRFWVQENRRWRLLDEPQAEIAGQKSRRKSDTREELKRVVADFVEKEAGKSSCRDIWRQLDEGAFDHTRLALMLWPLRVIMKCETAPHLANFPEIDLPKSLTKSALSRLARKHEAAGCPDLVDEFKAAFAECDEPLAERWQCLDSGKLDDLPLALELWPDRVIDECLADVALAKKHGVEMYFWCEDPAADHWRRLESPDKEEQIELERRLAPAVKAALKSLLEAPAPAGSGKRRKRTTRRRTKAK